MSFTRRPMAVLLLPALALACGGGREAEAPSRSGADGQRGGVLDPDGPGAPGDPAARHCSDGTCHLCGSGFCPVGFYCDETIAGGPACSWLPDCATDASCSCVERTLGSSCSCDEREGGLYVQCS